MGTLKKLRLAFGTDRDMRKMLVRGSHNEILLDLDGDKQADIALQDINGDGDIDRFAFDVTGDGWFNLFVDDTDRNGIPDRVFAVQYGGKDAPDKVVELASGPEFEQEIIATAKELSMLMQAGEYISADLQAALRALDKKASKADKFISAAKK